MDLSRCSGRACSGRTEHGGYVLAFCLPGILAMNGTAVRYAVAGAKSSRIAEVGLGACRRKTDFLLTVLGLYDEVRWRM